MKQKVITTIYYPDRSYKYLIGKAWDSNRMTISMESPSSSPVIQEMLEKVCNLRGKTVRESKDEKEIFERKRYDLLDNSTPWEEIEKFLKEEMNCSQEEIELEKLLYEVYCIQIQCNCKFECYHSSSYTKQYRCNHCGCILIEE